MTNPPTLADLMTDPGELDVSSDGPSPQHDHAGGGPVAPLYRRNPPSLVWAAAVRPVDPGGSTFGPIGRPTKHNPAIAAWTGYAPNWQGCGGYGGGAGRTLMVGLSST